MKKNKIIRYFRYLNIRYSRRTIEEKLYIGSIIPLSLIFPLSYFKHVFFLDAALISTSFFILFMTMISAGYLIAFVTFLKRFLNNTIITALVSFILVFYYKIVDTIGDHLIHLATGLNPSYFDNAHYFINTLVGLTLSALIISFLIFVGTLLTVPFQLILSNIRKKKYSEILLSGRLFASIIILFVFVTFFDYSFSRIIINTQKIVVYSDYYIGSECSHSDSNERIAYLNGNNISVAEQNKEGKWTFSVKKCNS